MPNPPVLPTLTAVPAHRALLLLSFILTALPVWGETVQLRRPGNATIITFEYITLDEEAIMVKRLDSDAVLNYKWEDLDLDWVSKNNPKLWAERQQLLAEAKSLKKMSKKEAEVDPFAQGTAATDNKSMVKNLLISLQDGLKGMSLSANRVEVVCYEFQLDENLFWLAFDELKQASLLSGKAEPSARTEDAAEENKDANSKTKAQGKSTTKTKVRTAASTAAESAARKSHEGDSRPYNSLGYLRMLAEGGTRGKPVWMMLRRATADRETMLAMLEKYAKLCGDLSVQPQAAASKTELVVLKKALENCAESLAKVNRENNAVEARLQSDCRTLLALVLR